MSKIVARRSISYPTCTRGIIVTWQTILFFSKTARRTHRLLKEVKSSFSIDFGSTVISMDISAVISSTLQFLIDINGLATVSEVRYFSICQVIRSARWTSLLESSLLRICAL